MEVAIRWFFDPKWIDVQVSRISAIGGAQADLLNRLSLSTHPLT
ncbi:hypothetical protein [Coleofasciculus sp. G2-EDA-02]